MATLTLALNSTAEGTLSSVFTLTEAQMGLFVAALQAIPPGGLTPPVTSEQVFQAWADDVFSQVVQITLNYQQAQAVANLIPISSST
jgi:hypothetical protein